MEFLRKRLPTPSRDWIVRKVTDALVASGVDRDSIEYDNEEFRLRSGNTSYFLGNVYHNCCLAWPWQRAGIIRRHLLARTDSGGELPDTFHEVKERLLPGVRDSVVDPLGPANNSWSLSCAARAWISSLVDANSDSRDGTAAMLR